MKSRTSFCRLVSAMGSLWAKKRGKSSVLKLLLCTRLLTPAKWKQRHRGRLSRKGVKHQLLRREIFHIVRHQRESMHKSDRRDRGVSDGQRGAFATIVSFEQARKPGYRPCQMII